MNMEPEQGSGGDRLATLEARLAAVEKRLPATNMVSDTFLRRAFTVWGHYFVANFLIGIAVTTVAGFVVLMVLMIAAIFN